MSIVRQRTRMQPPADLLNAVQGFSDVFKGRVGISVRDMDEGWTLSSNGDSLLPQQSVSKLWVAIAVMDAVDRGKLSLSDPVTVRRSDLTVFHQPIRPLVTRDGYRTTTGKLLEMALSAAPIVVMTCCCGKWAAPRRSATCLSARALMMSASGLESVNCRRRRPG